MLFVNEYDLVSLLLANLTLSPWQPPISYWKGNVVLRIFMHTKCHHNNGSSWCVTIWCWRKLWWFRIYVTQRPITMSWFLTSCMSKWCPLSLIKWCGVNINKQQLVPQLSGYSSTVIVVDLWTAVRGGKLGVAHNILSMDTLSHGIHSFYIQR